MPRKEDTWRGSVQMNISRLGVLYWEEQAILSPSDSSGYYGNGRGLNWETLRNTVIEGIFSFKLWMWPGKRSLQIGQVQNEVGSMTSVKFSRILWTKLVFEFSALTLEQQECVAADKGTLDQEIGKRKFWKDLNSAVRDLVFIMWPGKIQMVRVGHSQSQNLSHSHTHTPRVREKTSRQEHWSSAQTHS